MGEGICGQVALDGKPRRVPDVSEESSYIEVDSSTRSELCVPLKIGDRLIGVINAEREQVDGFTASDERLLSTIAGQMATALDRLRATSAVHDRARQLAILSNSSQEVAASLIPDQVYTAIHQAAAQLMTIDVFQIVLRGEDQEELTQVYSIDQNGGGHRVPNPPHTGLNKYVISTGESLLIHDRQELARIDPQRAGDTESPSSILAVPLQLGDIVFGMLSCQSYRSQAYSADDLNSLNTLANQASIAIENAQLFEQIQHRLAELTFLSQIIAITATENDLTVALNRVCAELAQFLKAAEVSFALLNSQLTMAQVIAEYHDLDRSATLGMQIAVIGNPAMTSILESGHPLVIDDAGSDPLLVAMIERINQRGIASILIVPIIFSGEVVGTLEISTSNYRQFSAAEITLVEKVSNQVGQVLERLGLFAATRDQAERMAHLATISEGLNRPLTPDEVIESIGGGAMALAQSDRAVLYLQQEDGKVIAPWFKGLSRNYIQQVTERFEELPGGILMANSESISISDIDLLPEKSLLKALGREEGFQAMDLWPLVYKDDVVAAIGCYYDDPHVGSDAEQEVMLAFARQAAIALVNARLFDETRRRTAQLEALNAIIAEVAAASELDHLLHITLDHTLRALSSHIGGIWVPSGRVLRDVPPELGDMFAEINLEVRGGISPAIAISDWVSLIDGDPYFNYRKVVEKWDLRAAIIVPIISEKEQIGGLCIVSKKPRKWLAEEIALVEGVGKQLGGAIERIALLERIQENAQQVQHIIDTVPEGVILLDDDLRVVLANPVAQNYLIDLGVFDSGDILTHLGERPIGEFLEPERQNLWDELALAGPPQQVFELGAQPLEKGSAAGGWVMVLREVTQEREAQNRIQMQERLATVGQMAAGIAHDFNNILAAIVVYADLLRRDPNLSPDSKERLEIIQQQVHRAASLIKQILDFSRRSVMEQNLLELFPFCKEFEKLLRRVLPETISLEFVYQPGIYLVNADPTRLQQVLMNLAVNARDASPTGGTLYFELDQIRVVEGVEPPCPDIPAGFWNRVTVQDSGLGIPAEVLPHIFEPFFTTKPVGEGTGLGLAQAYGIIKQHDGYIDAHSIIGEGTTFHIYLPAQQPTIEEISLPETLSNVKGSGETVLLVEDDLTALEAMKSLLEDTNYTVITASNGQEAWQIYQEKTDIISLVVSDMVMPVLNGVNLYQALREQFPEVKMLFITGHPVNESDEVLLRGGNVSWLQKPFSVGAFNQAVQSLLHE
jgi:GAF domain-containing protein